LARHRTAARDSFTRQRLHVASGIRDPVSCVRGRVSVLARSHRRFVLLRASMERGERQGARGAGLEGGRTSVGAGAIQVQPGRGGVRWTLGGRSGGPGSPRRTGPLGGREGRCEDRGPSLSGWAGRRPRAGCGAREQRSGWGRGRRPGKRSSSTGQEHGGDRRAGDAYLQGSGRVRCCWAEGASGPGAARGEAGASGACTTAWSPDANTELGQSLPRPPRSELLPACGRDLRRVANVERRPPSWEGGRRSWSRAPDEVGPGVTDAPSSPGVSPSSSLRWRRLLQGRIVRAAQVSDSLRGEERRAPW